MASPENVCFEWFELCEREKQQDKKAHARIAGIVWLTSALYLYGATPGVSLFSLSAMGFFTLGILAISTVIGQGGYLAQRMIDAILIRIDMLPGPGMVVAIRALSCLLFVTEVLATYEIARAAFDRVTGT